MDGKAMQESIDAKGNYIANSGTEHVDHGSRDDKTARPASPVR